MTRSLGRYRLIAELGRGGMGIVSLALTQGVGRFNKLAVIKELAPEIAEDPTFVSMFLDEARLAARLNHPNIVQTYEVGEDGHRYFMAMEYLEGRTLSRILRRLGRAETLSLEMHLRVLCEVLAGLHYAQELTDYDGKPLRIVHRDINPHNVFVTFDGHVKLMDFGIAKTVDASQETMAGVLKGKIGYMSPEQSRAEKVDRRADIFSVGVMLWEALVGRRMWEGQTDVEVLGKLMRGDIPSQAAMKPDVAPELAAACARALAASPNERYATAQEMLEDIEVYLESSRMKRSLRELGALVAEAFARERVQLREVIDAYLSKLGAGSPALDLESIGQSVSSIAAGLTPAQHGSHDEAPPSTSRLEQAIPPSRATFTRTPATGSMVSSPPPRKRWLVPGAVVTMAAATALVFLSRARPKDDVPPAPTTAASAKLDRVTIGIRVTPADAVVTLDGKPVENPFLGTFPKDDAPHELRATGKGYETKSQVIRFDANVTAHLSLQQLAQPAPSTHAAPEAGARAPRAAPVSAVSPAARANTVPTAAPAAPAPEISPTGGKPPLRAIDSSNPYGAQ